MTLTPGKLQSQTIAGLNAIVWLPPDYNTTTQKYPLIIALNGSGVGSYASAVNEGILKQLPGNSTASKFIIIGFADRNYGWPYLDGFIDAVMASFRVDPAFIIGTGLSQGATDLMKYKLNLGTPSATARLMIKMVLVSCPAQSGTDNSLFKAAMPCTVKFVTGIQDSIIAPLNVSTGYCSQFNQYDPAKGSTAIAIPGGHDPSVWDAVYSDPATYSWMLAGSIVPVPVQANPVTVTHTIVVKSDGSIDIK